MALYTLKTEEDALKPLKDYNGNSEWVKNRAVELGVRQAPTDANSNFNENINSRYDEIKNAQMLSKNQGYKTLLGSTWDSAVNSLDKATSKLTEGIAGDGDLNADSVRDAFNKLSDDDKWDVYQNFQKARNEFNKSYTKADNENNEELKNMYGAGLKYVDLYSSILDDIDKGQKSFGKSVGDWLTSGGVAGNMAQPITNAMGDIGAALGDTGSVATAKAIQNNYQTQNEGNNPIVQAIDTTSNLAGNIGLATMTGGIAPLATSGANLAHEGISALNDADRTYYTDENGNIIRQNQTDAQKGADIGGAALNVGLNLLGAKGIGPSMNFGNGTFQGLAQSGNYGEIAKGLGKYALKEVPWALGTSAADTAIQSLGYGQDAWKNFGDNVGKNILGDVAMDVAGAVRQGTTGNRDLLAGNKKRIATQESPETELYRTVMGNKQNGDNYLAYGESDLANKTNRGMIANGLERWGNALEGAQADATRQQLRKVGIESSGKVIENVRQKTGITNLETQAALAKELTGGENSLMDNIQRQALTASQDGKPYRVDTTPILSEVESIVNKYADSNTFSGKNGKEQFIKNIKSDINSSDKDVISIANRMKAIAADSRGKGSAQVPAADAAKAKIYTEIANKLNDLSYSAIPRENVEAMFDATISEMRGRAEQAKQNGNKDVQKAYNKLANKLEQTPHTIPAYRSFKKDFVDVSTIDRLTAPAENGAAQQMGRSFGTGLKRLTGTLAQRPVNNLLAKLGSGINVVANKIEGGNNKMQQNTNNTTQTRVRYPQSQVLWNTINRENNTTGEPTPTIQEAEIVPANMMQNDTQMQGAQSNQAGYFYPPTGDQWSDMLSQAMVRANEAGDMDALVELNDMYQTQVSKLSKSGQSSASNLNATQQAQLAKFDAAGNAIDQLEDLFDKAGGGKGPIAGTLQSIAGNWGWDSNAKTYNDLSEGLVNQIAQAIGKTDSLNTEGEVQRALKLIPQLNDDATTAKNKLETLRQMLGTTKQSYNTAYGINQY